MTKAVPLWMYQIHYLRRYVASSTVRCVLEVCVLDKKICELSVSVDARFMDARNRGLSNDLRQCLVLP